MPVQQGASSRGRWLPALGLALAGLMLLFFAVRLGIAAVHWSERRDTGVQAWMTVGFVAHAWQVDRSDLAAALGVPASDRSTLDAIAAQSGRPPAEVVAIVERAIAEAEAGR